MARVPNDQYQTIYDLHIGGTKVPEIASRYECTGATIYNILSRVKARLEADGAPGQASPVTPAEASVQLPDMLQVFGPPIPLGLTLLEAPAGDPAHREEQISPWEAPSPGGQAATAEPANGNNAHGWDLSFAAELSPVEGAATLEPATAGQAALEPTLLEPLVLDTASSVASVEEELPLGAPALELQDTISGEVAAAPEPATEVVVAPVAPVAAQPQPQPAGKSVLQFVAPRPAAAPSRPITPNLKSGGGGKKSGYGGGSKAAQTAVAVTLPDVDEPALFRSVEELLAAIKPQIRNALRNGEEITLTIRNADASALEEDAA